MKNALILHGIFNNHSGNWFPWLKTKLEKKGYKTYAPDLITSENPNTDKSFKKIKTNWQFNKDSIIIGHSSGAAMALGFLQKLNEENKTINKAILVSGFKDVLTDEYSKNRKGLFTNPFNWKKIKSAAKKIIILHSQDDPYVKPQQAYYMQKKLDCQLIMKENQGHFNLEKSKKYKKFPLLLKLI
jgi:uncharacterized protein